MASLIKIEVFEHEKPMSNGKKFNTVVVTPRDESKETIRQMDLILHAIMSSSQKRGGFVLGSKNILRIDVLADESLTDLTKEV